MSIKMAEAQKKVTHQSNNKFGENKEEISEQDYEEFKNKLKSKPAELENNSPGYVIFNNAQEADITGSTDMGACAEQIYKSLGNIYDEMKKITSVEIIKAENEEVSDVQGTEEPLYDELKTPSNMQPDEEGIYVERVQETIQEENAEKIEKPEYEEIYKAKEEISDSQEVSKGNEVKYPDVPQRNPKPQKENGDTPKKIDKNEENLYNNIDARKSKPHGNNYNRTKRISMIQENEDGEQMVEIVTDCYNCRYIVTAKPEKLIQEISAAKTLMKSYKSKVDQLQKENRNAGTALTTICAELENKKVEGFTSRFSIFFPKKRKSETPTSMTDQIKTITEHIQKTQNNQDLLQKKLHAAEEEIKNLQKQLNQKFTRQKSISKVSKITRNDFSVQVDEENFKNHKCEDKLQAFLKFEGQIPTDLRIQLEEMKLQLNGILNEIEITKAAKNSEDKLKMNEGDKLEKQSNHKEDQHLEKPVKKVLGDKEEVVD